ncbi:16S rRNA (guanine(966)-N(2))-methyltransferase RsmD [Candidatus Saccharibacteria bacterium]|nr:16S rRNA (guanine(966)-N(2))-methyltransferase RsmD [Candidatus Saccharibacteria bacterium]
MHIRLIAGSLKGRRIAAPDNSRTHPMSERIRNAVFNSIGVEVQNARILDAFAGTGAVGFEAISRGAQSVLFIEKDRVAQKILNENIDTLELKNTKLVRASVAGWCDTYKGEPFDIIFADPPYHDPQFSTVIKLFALLKPGALMVLSHPGKGEVPIQTGVVVVDNRSYGNAVLTYYRREHEKIA